MIGQGGNFPSSIATKSPAELYDEYNPDEGAFNPPVKVIKKKKKKKKKKKGFVIDLTLFMFDVSSSDKQIPSSSIHHSLFPSFLFFSFLSLITSLFFSFFLNHLITFFFLHNFLFT